MIPEYDTLVEELRSMYATVLELPLEVVTPEVDLEAEFGMDSLQHRLVLHRAAERWELTALPECSAPAALTPRSVADMLRHADSVSEKA
ncbi:phosphopantetheine-binding protein [Saccharopolyspora sp. ASAGF58]|uniref:phosphopantetheine-binding protein n=1 Tax=Saccharopolyspora sp. ASAGF58 TaxID=2719023 RepID=UPI00143FF83D|nr:phosphopantetheine-binding protein [Saccharopolyspora sp. ASAGF58]QIZ33776.1 hypothetical protein FDZ84_02295 [Saccharopolyspora sp. ASAGF58]